MYTPTYEVAHLKCVKRLISSAALWCVASTRTRPRNLITTTLSPSRTEVQCLNCTCLWLHGTRANHLLGPAIIDAKAGAVSRSFRYTLSLPHEVDGHAAVDSINCGSRSNIIVRLLEEAKSQAQPEHGSCERSCGAVPWSTHILARILHEKNCYCLTIKLHYPLVDTHSA